MKTDNRERFLTCCSSSRVVYGHLVKGAEERDGDVCQGQVQEEVVGHGSHPCINNLSTCKHFNTLTQESHILNAGESYSQ